MGKGRLLFLACLLAAPPASGDDLMATTALVGRYDEKPSYDLNFGGGYESTFLDVGADLSVHSDRRYGAEISNWNGSLKHLVDNWFRIESGSTTFHTANVEFQAGRFAQVDSFDSPYSLFLNSAHLPALSLRFSFEKGPFFYESRWIELNYRSRLGAEQTPEAWRRATLSADGNPIGQSYPDRGANLRTVAWKTGPLRWGLQDAVVYTERSFDLEHFVSPLPAYLTQYVKGTNGRPWSNGSNENNIIGAFGEWTAPDFWAGGQFLLDDFSTYFLTPSQSPNNPWKVAWTLGTRLITDQGTWGFHHAGALKFTFEPITTVPGHEAETAYGYFYYPDVEYFDDYRFRAIPLEEDAIGYQHGENNFALMVTYDTPAHRTWNAHTSLEYLLAGANSPANPWHELTDGGELGSQWLDGRLQQSLVWKGGVVHSEGEWQFEVGASLGYVVNEWTLALPSGVGSSASLVDRFVKVFYPSEGSRVLASVVVSVVWRGVFTVPD